MSKNPPPADTEIYAELRDLARTIQQTRSAIAAIKPKDITASHIPQATDELDAVIGATEDATNKIMDVCDEITTLAPECPPAVAEKLIGCTTKIFEACNFQDITGQRISKVVNALKHIDAKVEALLKELNIDGYEAEPDSAAEAPPVDPDQALLNGPQLDGLAISQDEIDQLMGN